MTQRIYDITKELIERIDFTNTYGNLEGGLLTADIPEKDSKFSLIYHNDFKGIEESSLHLYRTFNTDKMTEVTYVSGRENKELAITYQGQKFYLVERIGNILDKYGNDLKRSDEEVHGILSDVYNVAKRKSSGAPQQVKLIPVIIRDNKNKELDSKRLVELLIYLMDIGQRD
jgi:hypothetical protein